MLKNEICFLFTFMCLRPIPVILTESYYEDFLIIFSVLLM